MRLHPAIQVEPWGGPPSHAEIVDERRQRDRDAPAVAGPPVPVDRVDDGRIAGVGVRVYVPARAEPTALQGALVWLHGGGWVFGSLESADGGCRRLADRSGLVVVSVDYRLSPEHVWPAAIDDAEAVVAALLTPESSAPGDDDPLADLAIDPTRVVVAGDSAGGFLAAVVTRRARDADRPVAGQVLVYPVVRRAALADLADEVGDDAGLSAAAMRWFWDQFTGPDGPSDHDHPDLDPLAADLVDLPPTLVISAEHDVLRAEGQHYAEALQAAGVDVVATTFAGVHHGFFRHLATLTAARSAVDLVAAWSAEQVA